MTSAPPDSPVQRIFLGWDAPALPTAAEILADQYTASGGMNLRDVVLVTPAARAGRRLAELLLEKAEARGLVFTPPKTVTIGRFPELLYLASRPTADTVVARHAYARALQHIEASLLEPVFPTRPGTVSGWLALAGVVEGLHRELGAEGLGFREVARAFRTGFPYDDSVRWEVLGQVQERFREVLRDAGLGDADLERRRALDEGAVTSPGDVWLVGVVEMPAVVRRLVVSLEGSVRALIHAPEEVGDHFDALGCVVSESWSTASIPIADSNIRVVQRPGDQAEEVLDMLHGFGSRYSAEDVVMGVPDQELVPYLERSLSMVEVPHRFAGGTPLEETGPFRALQALADFLDGRPYPAFGALIRHPDLHDLVEAVPREGGDGRISDRIPGRTHRTETNSVPGAIEPFDASPELTGALTTVDHYQSEHLQAALEAPLPGAEKHAVRTRRLLAHLETSLALERFTGTRPLSEWMPEVLEFLVRVYGGAPLDQASRTGRRLLEVVSRIRGAATRLATLPSGLDVRADAPEAIRVLLSELRGPANAIPPDPEEHAVELLGWLELPLDDAPAVILTGVNDQKVPESLGGDPFLPSALRSFLKIPDDRARYARDAYLLSALIHSREEVHLLAGRLSAAGDPLRPSRLLFAAPDQDVARRVLRYLGEELEEGAPSVDSPEPHLPEGPRPSSPSRFRSPPQDPIRASHPPDRIRVTDFRKYLEDPYGYALNRILGLESLDDGAREMEGTTFGHMAHVVLERFGRSQESESTDPEVVERKLTRLLEGTVHEIFGRRPVPAVRVQVEQLRARLRSFSRWQSAWAEKGWRIVCVEKQPDPGVPFDVDGEIILLRGKIDRIDHNPDTGEWAIFDYKTGDSGKAPEKAHRKGRGESKEWIDLQLPLYRKLLSGVVGDDGDAVVPQQDQARAGLGYILLPKKLEAVGGVLAEWTEAELAEAEETARRVVRELRAGEFFFDPGVRGFRDDPFDALLGRLELPAEDDPDAGGEA